MEIDPILKNQIERSFAQLKPKDAGHFPTTGALSTALTVSARPKSKEENLATLQRPVATMFCKAGVDIWMRGVHSFLVSASLTDVSPIWASVAGYYSSHYSVRAIAHVFGFFQLYSIKQKAQLDLSGNQPMCAYSCKNGGEGEHQLYWKIVKANPLFAGDNLFTNNNVGIDPSDSGHRNLANYKDFLQYFPAFQPLNRDQMRERIQRISGIEFTAPPIPRATKFPDIESVQVVAYHRLVRFRDLLDEILVNKSNFWNVHRNPPWARDFINYQLVDSQIERHRFG